MLRRVRLRRTGISAKGRTPISRGSAPQGVSAKRKSQRLKLIELRLFVLERDEYRCRACRTRSKPLEAHHVIKRSQAPTLLLDPTNVVTLCGGPGGCHAWTDAPYSAPQGRLVIERARGSFVFSVVRAANKFVVRQLAASPLLGAGSTGSVGNALHTDRLGTTGA